MSENKERISAVIIDDEERAVNTLRSLLEMYVPQVKVVASGNSVPEGVLLINKHRPNIVFLDIEMPEYNGFELLNFFREIDFEIIFVTAYNEYALRAFEASAVDYLLKPVDIEKLQNAVEKVGEKLQTANIQERLSILQDSLNEDKFKKIALPVSDGLLFQDTAEIIYLEADGAYTSVCTKDDQKILISKNLKFFEEILINNPAFFRSHRSYIVNLNYIKKYSKSENTIVLDNNSSILIARERKTEFEQQLKENNISAG